MRRLAFVVALTMLTSYLPVGAQQSGWVSIVSPAAGEILAGRRAEVSVSFNTGSSNKVTRIEVDVEGKPYATKNLGEPSERGIASFLVDTTRFQNGVHSIIVKVYSGSALIGSASNKCAISNQPIDVLPPTVRFIGIRKDKTYSGTAEVEVKARDGSDQDPLVSICIDKSLKLVKNTPPYRYTWDTREYENGRHVLSAYAYDQAGNRGDAEAVEVTVQNTGHIPLTAETNVESTKETTVAQTTEVTNKITVVVSEPVRTKPIVPVERVTKSTTAARAESAPKTISSTVNTAAARPDRPRTAVRPAPASTTPVPTVKPTSDKPMILAEATPPALGDPEISRPSVTRPVDQNTAARAVETRPATGSIVHGVKIIPSAPVESPSQVSRPSSVKPAIPAKVPERQPVAETVRSVAVARIDQPLVIAELPKPELLSSGPEPEPPAVDTDTPATDTVSAGDQPSGAPEAAVEASSGPSASVETVTPEPAVSAAVPNAGPKRDDVLAERTEGVGIGQKLIQPKAILPDPVKMARAPKSELPKLDATPDPRQVAIRLKTKMYKGMAVTGLRYAIEAAGGRILTWDSETRTVIAEFGYETVRIQVGQPVAIVGGKTVRLSCVPFIAKRGRMMVDIGLLKAVLGTKFEVDSRTGECRILS